MSERYSRLQPLAFEERLTLCLEALSFFSPLQSSRFATIIEKPERAGVVTNFNVLDFVKYLEKSGKLPHAFRSLHLISELLENLSNNKILLRLGTNSNPLGGMHYTFLKELTNRQRTGVTWLAQSLGPDFIWHTTSQSVFQIVGTRSDGDRGAGTGIVIANRWGMTCRHVLSEMKIDQSQNVHGQRVGVLSTFAHESIDVGFLQFDHDVSTVAGLAFRDPNISEEVFTLGYPLVPLAREATLVMQRGEVTNPLFKTTTNDDLFLFSAIARPGNSGGPVVASNGEIVGIVASEIYAESPSGRHSPFFAGIRTSEISQAISDLKLQFLLPIEDYS